jgi:hypothetical protein
MSKYQEFQQLFVTVGQQHRLEADLCFDAIDDLTSRIVDDAGWFPDDVELIDLAPPFATAKPSKILRFKRIGRNREHLRDVASQVEGWWCLGIRFRLKPHTTVIFQPPEVMFVLPVWVQCQGHEPDRSIRLKIDSTGREYAPDEFGDVSQLTLQRMQTWLEAGVLPLLHHPDRGETLQVLGIVLDRDTLRALATG